MTTAMRVWASPNGVQHIVPPHGACATCGNSRHEVCAHCGGDIHRSQPTGSGWLWAHDNDGTTLCAVDGVRTGTRAEPDEEQQ